MSHILTPFLNKTIIVKRNTENSIDNINAFFEMENSLPSGWKDKFHWTLHGIVHVLGVELQELAIKDGVLYIKRSSAKLSVSSTVLFDHVVRSVLQQSAQTCMVCGQYARRRKEQAHKPALCREHYLEYINALED